MFKKLWVRFSGIFLLFVIMIAMGMTLLMGYVIRNRFTSFIEKEGEAQTMLVVARALENYYTANGSLDGIELLFRGSDPGPGGGQGMGQGMQPGGNPGMQTSGSASTPWLDRLENLGRGIASGARVTITDPDGIILFTRAPNRSAGDVLDSVLLDSATPLYSGSDVIGYVILDDPVVVALTAAQQQFIRSLNRTVLVILISVGTTAIFLGAILSRAFTRPLGEITTAAQKVAGGQLGTQVIIRPDAADEFRQLGQSFNAMSTSLADSEAQRQRLTADVAHELRTPLSVMRAQLQSMMDEVRPLSIENIAIVYDENLHLTRLVEDLRTLTLAESGHLPLEKKTVRPGELVQRAYDLFLPLADDEGILLNTAVEESLPEISADPGRIQQVLANLIVNALRHSDKDGDVLIEAKHVGERVRFVVSNAGITLSPESAKNVFERFWRADESRARDKGGAGLGLSISRQLVLLHGGDMRVEIGENRTSFIFEIPANS